LQRHRQPQRPAADVSAPQQRDFSDGAQQTRRASGAQQSVCEPGAAASGAIVGGVGATTLSMRSIGVSIAVRDTPLRRDLGVMGNSLGQATLYDGERSGPPGL